jgi:membrane protease YdiL (CAAX protease family)
VKPGEARCVLEVMASSPGRLATRRPLLFSTLVTLIFIVALLGVVVAQKTAVQPFLQEAIGAAGRAVIGVGALIWLAGLGWRRWLAGAGSGTSWLLIVLPLAYVLIVYPLLFTATYRLSVQDKALVAMVAANGFMAGAMEELIFRGLLLGSLLRNWGVAGRGLWRALVVSSLFFSVPHGLNVLAGAEPLSTASQLIWAWLLGLVLGALMVAGGSLWPVAVFHGVANALIHAQRYGHKPATDLATAALLAVAPLPLVLYSWRALRRFRRLSPTPSAGT